MDSYFTGREMTNPYTSGKKMEDYSIEELCRLTPELTEEERKNPFSKYYDEPMAKLQPHMKAAMEKPLASEKCYMPTEAGKIMLLHDQNYPECGYGVLENGVGYASAKVYQDGITDEMIKYYRENFAVSEECRNLFYKTWFPGNHLIHFTDGIVENFGWGFVRQEMNWDIFQMKGHLGVSMEDIPQMDPHCIAMIGLGGMNVNIQNPEDIQHTCMVQYTRETEDGRELWVHYWNGLKLIPDGTIEVCPSVDKETMTKYMKMMMEHAMYEFVNELKHMKEFWEETH